MSKQQKRKPKCKKCVPDPLTRKSYTGVGYSVIDTYRCARCGRIITNRPFGK